MVQRMKFWEVGKKGKGVHGGLRNNFGRLGGGGGRSLFWGWVRKRGEKIVKIIRKMRRRVG